jgi:parallel beta-helix repeat protein/predicted outer membrane repeat protein
MSHSFAVKQVPGLTIPARLALALALAVGLVLSLAPAPSAHAATVRYVKPSATGSDDCSSWANACTLQSALGVAVSGDEIWVAEGTHTPGTDRTATFQLKSGVGVYGGFAGTETARSQRDWAAHPTVLSGEIGAAGNSDNAYHVVTGSGTDATAVLDRFTVSGGNASGSYPSDCGGGMYNDDGSPTLTNVTFSGNSASYGGGGMSNDSSSSPTLTNVTFSGNSAPGGGGVYTVGGSPTLTNVTFSGNSASFYGGGMYNSYSSPTLTDVTFSGNSATYGGGMSNLNSSPTLTGVTFSDNTASPFGGGMYNNISSSPSLTNVTFSGNSASHGGGMYNYDSSSPVLTNVTFSGNSASDRGGGMYNYDSSSPVLTNVTFSGNSANVGGGGGMLNDNSSPTLTNCILWGNTAYSGSQIYNSSSTPTVTYSDVQGGYAGTGNISADPLFVDADGPDDIAGTLDDNLRLHATSPAVDAGDNTAPGLSGITTDLDGTPRFVDVDAVVDTGKGTAPIVDMGAYEAGLLYVKWDATGADDGSCWADAFTDLQTALGVAVSGDEIWVAEGTYTPGTDRAATFQLKSGVGVYGGFAGTETAPGERDWVAHPTVLSGDVGTPGDNSDNAYHVVTGSGTDASAVLDGFTVSGGNADGSSQPDDCGGGMFNSKGDPTLTNVTFSGNSAIDGGGMFNTHSSPSLTNVTFSGNSASSAGGGMLNDCSSPVLTNVTFSGNSAAGGGGMFNSISSPTLTNVTFSGNSAASGGGMFNSISSPTLTNVTFSGNSANDGGGMSNYDSSPTLTNVTFSGNSANYGGGMYNYNSSPTLTNVTFSGNIASYDGGGMLNDNSSPTLANCILWGNTADSGPQIYNSSSTPTVTYSDIQGGYPGTGNISADPLFVDADGPDDIAGTLDDNLRLHVGSPAIDAGDNTAVPAGVTTDLDGNPRITGAAVDMGAYEVGDLYHVFLPLVSRNYAVAPDLIVERITATSNDVQVVVKNRGDAPVTDEFWVQVYVDPHPAPSAVNQLWYDLGDQGMFWGVVSSALPLAPGEAITLTYGDAYYWPSVSRFDEALPAGTPVYAQVDAYNAATTYGAVLESHEIAGGAYNNVAGPVYSTSAASRRGQPGAEPRATGRPQDVSRTNLPPLPGQ